MSSRSVFLVEDRDAQRLSYKLRLESRGFHVDAAGDVDSARQFIESGREYDVAVLDMRLEDPAHEHVTGAQLGEELSRKLGTRSPGVSHLLRISRGPITMTRRCASVRQST